MSIYGYIVLSMERAKRDWLSLMQFFAGFQDSRFGVPGLSQNLIGRNPAIQGIQACVMYSHHADQASHLSTQPRVPCTSNTIISR